PGLVPGSEPDLIRDTSICGILSTVKSTLSEVCGHHTQLELMGPFPASINVLCNPVRPYLPAAGTALVREGARNLVVILRKSQFLCVRFPRRMKPAVFDARPTARKVLNSTTKLVFSSQTGA